MSRTIHTPLEASIACGTVPRASPERWAREARELLADIDLAITDAYDVDSEGATARVDLAPWADLIRALVQAEATG